MVVKKFYADSAREALRLVRDALGANAMILSNKRTAAGVEVMAASESDVAAVASTGGVAMRAMSGVREPRRAVQSAPAAPTPATAVAKATEPEEPPGYSLVQEVRFLRSMLEGQL